MKDHYDKTKVAVRHLPPALKQSELMDKIDGSFAGRYNWVSFHPGKTSHKREQYSRAYIDFKKADDVFEFAGFFNGHVFHYEKGTQYKALVEYAPSQRVPKQWSKKDGREGTIFKDPEYSEFLDILAKPVENLPSAEVQLERREAERAGAAKEPAIVTPLMEFIRQKRAARSGSQRPLSSGKISRRTVGASPSNSRPSSSKRSSEKKKSSSSMYVLRDSVKNVSGKEKSTYALAQRRESHQLSDKSITGAAASGTKQAEDGIGASRVAVPIKKKVPLLKGKEREISHTSGGISQQLGAPLPVKKLPGPSNLKQSHRREASGRIIRSILSNKDVESGQKIQFLIAEKNKQPLRPATTPSSLEGSVFSASEATNNSHIDLKRAINDTAIGNDLHTFAPTNDNQEQPTRNKDRPDCGIWTLRRSDESSFLAKQLLSESVEGTIIANHALVHGVSKPGDVVENEFNNKSSQPSGKPRNLDSAVHSSRFGRGVNSPLYGFPTSNAEMKVDMLSTSRSREVKTPGDGRSNYLPIENGSHRHGGRRGQGVKDLDVSIGASDGKLSKRGSASSYGSPHEKQVWVQKSGSGS